MAANIKKLAENRVNGEFLTQIRNGRVENNTWQDWKDRLETLDSLYSGNFTRVFPNEDYDQDLPHVMNIVQVGMDDLARLVTEAKPSVTVMPESDSNDHTKKAYLQEAICETYWDVNDGELLAPRIALDLAGAGAAFLVVDSSDPVYPCIHRVDPRYAYPDIQNGSIQDLLVVQTYKLRVAARLFPRLNLAEISPHIADEAEILEYYSATECVQAVMLMKGKKPLGPENVHIAKRWKPTVGMVPVAFAQLDTFDGQFRGMFDQIKGVLNTKNRLVRQMLDYADRAIYAPIVSKGLLNPEEEEGPSAHYRLDQNTPDAQMGRLAPAGPAPQLFTILQFLDQEQRAGASYPAQRQGEVNQSIASAAFVNSTMGHLTTSVRNLQRLEAQLRRQAFKIAAAIDRKELDFDKPLTRSVGKKKTYRPGRDLTEHFRPLVSYGAGAGMDRLNADVRILQHLGAGLISRETAREQIDYLEKDGEESDRIDRETAMLALGQKFLAEAPWQMVAKVIKAMENGDPLPKAIEMVMEEEQPAQEPGAEAIAAAGGQPAGPSPEAPMEEQLALQKGGTQEVEFPNQPLTNILVGR